MIMERKIRVALDGPSGSGKSTIAKKLAATLNFVYVDTGAMYRSVGLYVKEHGVKVDDVEGIAALLPEITLELKCTEEGQKVFLCGEDVSGKIRTEEISMCASAVSKLPVVRAFLTAQQKEMAARGGIVMDGRDIGTVVIPDAEVKFFVVTPPEVRAKRRYAELIERGETAVYEDVLRDIVIRDENDSKRDIAPLKAAEDAVLLDNTGSFEDTVNRALEIIRAKAGL